MRTQNQEENQEKITDNFTSVYKVVKAKFVIDQETIDGELNFTISSDNGVNKIVQLECITKNNKKVLVLEGDHLISLGNNHNQATSEKTPVVKPEKTQIFLQTLLKQMDEREQLNITKPCTITIHHTKRPANTIRQPAEAEGVAASQQDTIYSFCC